MPEFLKYDGVDGDVRGPSSPKGDGTSNTLMVAEQYRPMAGDPDAFVWNSQQDTAPQDGAYVLTSTSHAATFSTPDADWLVS